MAGRFSGLFLDILMKQTSAPSSVPKRVAKHRDDHGDLQSVPNEEIPFFLDYVALETVGNAFEEGWRCCPRIVFFLGVIRGRNILFQGEDACAQFVVWIGKGDLFLSLLCDHQRAGNHIYLVGRDGGDQGCRTPCPSALVLFPDTPRTVP